MLGPNYSSSEGHYRRLCIRTGHGVLADSRLSAIVYAGQTTGTNGTVHGITFGYFFLIPPLHA